MASMIRSIVCAAMALALLGCGDTRSFVRPDAASLANGQTSHAQVLAQMGPPWMEGSVIVNEQTLKMLQYGYVHDAGKLLHEGPPGRNARFYLHKGILVGHAFYELPVYSATSEENPALDERKMADIARGKTRRGEVLALLGQANGHYIHPLIKAPGGEALVYGSYERGSAPTSSSSGRKFTSLRKVLVVTFDAAGLVTDLEFTLERGD